MCAAAHETRRGIRHCRGHGKTWLLVFLAAGLAAAFLSSAHGPRAANAAPSTESPVDIEIAIDGTGSMAAAIAKAKSEGVGALRGISSLLPDSRFAVVVFRDHGNPAGEYQLLQPLTSDAAKVQEALNRVTTHSNPSPNNGPAESYNLAFHMSYSDARIGWRPSARKIVVVLGDAEPNGAGAAGVQGCRDTSSDPEGLSTPRELANMRAAGLTLVMVREVSAGLSVSLQCYESLAAGAYVGGTARDANSDLAATIVELIEGAYAPVTVKNDLGVALRNGRTGYTITVKNPNALGLMIKSLAFVLPPSGFRYVRSSIIATRPVKSGRTLTWALNMSVRARQTVGFHVLVRTPGHIGRYRSNVVTRFQTAGGNELTSRRPGALLSIRRRIHAVRLSFLRKTAAGTALTGRAAASFGRWKGLPAVGPASGRLVAQRGMRRLVLQAQGLRLDSLAVPTRTRLRLRVIGSSGYRGCHVGTRATLLVSDSNNVLQNDRGSTLVLSLPRGCGGRTIPKATLTFAAN
jgi:hypothetical protein